MFFNKDKSAHSSNRLTLEINKLHSESRLKIEEYEQVIVFLEKKIMDHNDIDSADELRRTELRPLTNELMNQLKIDRNLTKMVLHEVNLYKSTLSITQQVYDRLATRVSNANKDMLEAGKNIKELVGQLKEAKPELFTEKGFICPLIDSFLT